MAAITLKHINKEYGDGYIAVKDVSLDIGDGDQARAAAESPRFCE